MDTTPLRTADHWCALHQVQIINPGGWNGVDAPAWDDLISEQDFLTRMNASTIMVARPARDASQQLTPAKIAQQISASLLDEHEGFTIDGANVGVGVPAGSIRCVGALPDNPESEVRFLLTVTELEVD
jgi:hypothetical protein